MKNPFSHALGVDRFQMAATRRRAEQSARPSPASEARPQRPKGAASKSGAVAPLRTRVVLTALFGFWLISTMAGCSFVQKFSRQSQTKSTVSNEKLVHLDSFVVNLADPGSDAYLRVGIDVGVRADSPAITAEGVDPASVGLIRDTILKIVTTRTSADLLTPDGKDELKKLLLDALQKRDPALGATAIYFTDFLIQR